MYRDRLPFYCLSVCVMCDVSVCVKSACDVRCKCVCVIYVTEDAERMIYWVESTWRVVVEHDSLHENSGVLYLVIVKQFECSYKSQPQMFYFAFTYL